MNPAANVVLVGPMGAGKSSIGRRLAEHFGLQFVDADREIEARTGATVTTIFECEGEPGFRARECVAMAELLARDGCLVASGGGAVLDAGTRALMQARSFVVYLHVDVAQQSARLARDRSRPLLLGDDRDARLERLAQERDPLYEAIADLRFDTTPWSPADAARTLAQVLEARWQRGAQGEAAALAAWTVPVDGAQPYAITIAAGLLDDGAALARHVRGRHVLLVSDGNVAPLYAGRVDAALRRARPGLQVSICVLPPGEQDKTLAAFATVIDALAALGATRDACVLALGGGVVGDVAGFAAACWMRGIDCVQLPTTLLAMVDSAVGGKTAVDLPQGKNLVGAFHPPRAVLADLGTLATLPPRELRAGFAEVIKYGAIIDAPFLAWLDDNHRALLAHDADTTAAAVARSCRHKAAIVARDPLEHGERALLNFGHTFGHAIESAQGYAGNGDGLNHGEAVSVGMVLAARMSAALDMATDDDADALSALLQRFGLPVTLPPGLSPDDLFARMQLDKKAGAGGLRFVLWDGPGKARLVEGVPPDTVRAILQRAQHAALR